MLTGGLGFLGREIIRQTPSEVNLLITDRLESRAIPNLAHYYQPLDVTNLDERLFNGIHTVIHNAGIFDLTAAPALLESVNIIGSKKVAEAAVRAGVQHFIQVSSTSVYGHQPTPIKESATPKQPIHDYGRSKWLGEEASREVCQSAGILWSAVRPTLVYGPRSRYGLAPFIATLSEFAKSGRTVPLPTGGSQVHAVHVADVAGALWHICTQRYSGVFNVADDSTINFGELLEVLGEVLALKTRPFPVPWFAIRPLIRPGILRPILKQIEAMARKERASRTTSGALDLRLDEDWSYFLKNDNIFANERLHEIGYDFRFPNIREGLEDTISWYRNEGWL